MHPPALIVVPAATGFHHGHAGVLALHGCGGTTVIIELATAFADDESALERDREALREIMRVRIDPPVNLWPRRSRGIPYVDYRWPSVASVRDFSRVLPLTASEGETIASVDGMPAAVRCRPDLGTIIILGAPLGPTLLAGDTEARRWLGEVVAGSRARMDAYAARQRETRRPKRAPDLFGSGNSY